MAAAKVVLSYLASKLDGACEEVGTVAHDYLANAVRVIFTSDDEIRIFARVEAPQLRD
jgi:hypothetical protein